MPARRPFAIDYSGSFCSRLSGLDVKRHSLTPADARVFDRPAAGRSFFEQLIRDNLDVGRPESNVADVVGAPQTGTRWQS